jgi:hypothetical protein
MSNIDFSCLVTASTQAEQQALHHAAVVKAECKRRILAQFPQEAQHNIAQATLLYALNGAGPDAGLTPEDIVQVQAGWDWIRAMQAACRQVSQTFDADPLEDRAWPDLPADVAQLIKRY